MSDDIKSLKDIIKEEYKKCLESPAYFMRKYCMIEHQQRGQIPFNLFRFQERTLDQFRDNRFNIVLKARQMGISTLTAGYALWMMTFQESKTILVIATTQNTAKNLVTKVRFMHERLPRWLRVQETEDNKLSLKLKNGSQIVAVSSESDAARSFALSLLILDECCGPSTHLFVREDVTKEEIEIEIGDLYKSIKKYEVLTPSGWRNFSGIKKIEKDFYLKILFTDDTVLSCSHNHKLKTELNDFVYAKDLKSGDKVVGKNILKEIKSTETINEKIDLYDLLNVEGDNTYYSNDIVSHNCAFIDKADEIWTAAIPTLSTGGNAIILSTPCGVGDFFHKMWMEAETGLNNFNTIKLKWDLHPEHDAAWRELQTKISGPKAASQECDCSFLSSGNTVVEMETIQFFKDTYVKEPIEKRGVDHNYWMWQLPDYNRSYIVTADVSRGDSTDFSTFHVIDVETVEQVAEYKGMITTKDFGNLLVEVATTFNNAVLVIENNTIGHAVIQQVLDRQYSNLFYSSSDLYYVDTEHQMSNKIYRDEKKMTPGFSMSTRTRPLIISKLETYFRERVIVPHSLRLIEELFTFVWNNGKAEAMRGYNDDLVMSLGAALWIRDTYFRLNKEGINLQKTIIERIGKIDNSPSPIYTSNNTMQNNPWMMQVGNKQENLSWLL